MDIFEAVGSETEFFLVENRYCNDVEGFMMSERIRYEMVCGSLYYAGEHLAVYKLYSHGLSNNTMRMIEEYIESISSPF